MDNGSSRTAGSVASAAPANSKLVSSAELEKVARQKAEQESASAKPVFLTKKQRQQLALERRQQEVEAQRAAAADSASSSSSFSSVPSSSRIDPERRRRMEDRPTLAAAAAAAAGPPEAISGALAALDPESREKQLALIKSAYLGQRMEKKPQKTSTAAAPKSKFSFDWQASEDTTAEELHPLYRRSSGGSLLFGRGFQAGFDRREQRQKNKFYDELLMARGGGGQLEELRDMDKVHAREGRRREQETAARLRGRHWSEKRLEEMEERDWRIFREDFNIAAPRGTNVPHPLRFWSEGNFPAVIHETLTRVGYKEPTPIQRAAIPVALEARDVVGIAETGSGKTCAFLIPMLDYVSQQPPITEANAAEGPYALIMAPTRELAQQIQEECDRFAVPMGFKSVSIVGGLSLEDQATALREGAEVLIATPGRLFDCIERRYLVLNQCNYVVLDEADRMIDQNFEPQIIRIMDTMPSSNMRPESEAEVESGRRYRQTFMFSATMPPKVEALAKKYLRNPVFLSVVDRAGAAAKRVEQRVIWTSGESAKKNKLMELLKRSEPPIILFMNSKKNCDSMARTLERAGFRTTVIHGGKLQEQRMESLETFKKGRADILVATDVVGRGIDVSGVKHVINFDMPPDIERYTHRIGRTGRAGQSGVATSFLCEHDAPVMMGLFNMLVESGDAVPNELRNHDAVKNPAALLDKKRKKGGGGGGDQGFLNV